MTRTTIPHRGRYSRAFCVAALLACLAPAQAADVRPIAELNSLGDAATRTGPRVVVRGIVTWRNEQGRAMFLQDETAGIYADFPLEQPEAHLPDDVQVAVEIEAEGWIEPGGFAPSLRLETVRAIGPAPLPEPRPFTARRFFTGVDNGSFVEVTGVVRGVREEPFLWRVFAAHEARVFEVECRKAAMPADFAQWCRSLVDGEVRFLGSSSVSFNTRGEPLRPRLFVSRPDWIEPVALAEHEPFAAPKVAIDAVARYSAEPIDDHMIRTEGTVVHSVPGEAIFLQEGHHGLRVLAPVEQAFTPGDRVEVAGFVDRGGTVAGLSEAVVRLVSHGPAPAAIDIAPDEVATIHARSATTYVIADPGDYEGCLVRFPATLLERKPGQRGDLLVLAAGQTSVTARLPAGDVAIGRLEAGSRLLMMGILHVIPASDPIKWPLTAPTRMELVPRSAADIAILSRPSWWTPRRLAWALGLGAAVLATVLAWVFALRRQVRRQLAVIERGLREEAVIEERRRIAREFHDSLQQELAGLALRLESAAAHFDEPEVVDEMNGQRTLLSRIQSETRQFVWNLREPSRGHLPFGELLAAQCREQAALAAVRIEFHAEPPEPDVPQSARYPLLRIVGEAVANAVRHASASFVRVTFGDRDGCPRVEVADDGIGFDLAANETRDGHFGIRGMRERARRLGASLSIATAPGGGTRMVVELGPASAEVPMPSRADRGIIVAVRSPAVSETQ